MKWFTLILATLLAITVTSCRPFELRPTDGGSITVHGHDTYWESDDFPLWLLIDNTLPDEHITATLEAAAMWNHSVGMQVFEPIVYDFVRPAPRWSGFVSVSMRDLGASSRNTRVMGVARAVLFEESTHMRASQVWFDEDLDDPILLIVILHELGHSLTLDHDSDCNSVMHPYVVNCTQLVSLLPEDLERIRNMITAAPGPRTYADDMEFLPEVWRHLR